MSITILYVDDDSEDLAIFQEAINDINENIRFIPLKSAQDAFALLNRQTALPNLIFVDINMPVMDGKEFLKNLKIDKRLRNIPVIMYTTSRQQKEKDECKDLGAHDFITKTSTYPELIQKLRTVIQ
ncbi:MAG: response regulator [Cyclobacteriaceae bacterium]